MAAIEFKPLNIAIIQQVPGSGLNESFSQRLYSFKPDIIAFPEYFGVRPDLKSVAESLADRDKIIEFLANLSRKLGCVIVGGTIVELDGARLRNRSYLFDRGTIIGHYDKIHLYKNEGDGRIDPGNEYFVRPVENYRLGILVCADVLYPDTFSNMRGLRPDIVFIPTTSPYRKGESAEQKFARDKTIFGAGATRCDSLLFKISACGNIIGHPLQGRSLIASPGKIQWRVEPENEDKSALILVRLTGNKGNPILDIAVHRP